MPESAEQAASAHVSQPSYQADRHKPLSLDYLCENNCLEGDGAQGRDRTTDTAIFSRMLYQLSYLGAAPNAARGERRFIVRLGSPVQPPAGFPGLKSARQRSRKIHGIQGLPRSVSNPADLFRLVRIILVVTLARRNGIRPRQPPIQIDVPATFRAKRLGSLDRRLAADRAGFRGTRGFRAVNWHSTSQSEPENPLHPSARSSHKAADRPRSYRSRPA